MPLHAGLVFCFFLGGKERVWRPDGPVWTRRRGEADVCVMGEEGTLFDRSVCHCDALRVSEGQTADECSLTA